MENLLIFLQFKRDEARGEDTWPDESQLMQFSYIDAVIDMVEGLQLDHLPQAVADAISEYTV